MDALSAILLIEQDEDASQEEILEAYQSLISSGVVWQLQGSYGRAASHLIAEGLCHA